MYFSKIWVAKLIDIILNGAVVSPRGQSTREMLQSTLVIDMRKPVLRVPARQLHYKFMAAEAYWILDGDNRVDTIAPYNKRISEFSDDDETFFGAYGPKIHDQLPYVIAKLKEDRGTRQAGLTIWRESPGPTKDVPCTVAIFFSIRYNRLNAHVFMRSSDIWLGVPYDVFNFSMLSHFVCGILNSSSYKQVSPGALYLTAASSHLYHHDYDSAMLCCQSDILNQDATPDDLWQSPCKLMDTLKKLRHSEPGNSLRWWEKTNVQIES